jgi:hypothetical protein
MHPNKETNSTCIRHMYKAGGNHQEFRHSGRRARLALHVSHLQLGLIRKQEDGQWLSANITAARTASWMDMQ